MQAVKPIEFETDWYIIPNDKYQEFLQLISSWYDFQEGDIKYDIEEEIENKFGQYKTGGDLNLVQLYIEN